MSFIKRGGKALADIIPGLGKFTFDEDLGTIFITSGSGVIGYRVALSLLEAGIKNVRVGIWFGDRQVRCAPETCLLITPVVILTFFPIV